jgi:predicted transcriptional regulator
MPLPTPERVTDAELAVLRRLWKRGPSTIRELTDDLYPGGGASAYATVQKLLDRLGSKGCVSRRAAGRANVFTAEVGRGDLIERRLREIADTLCDGALSPLLTHLASSTGLSADELARLRSRVEELDRESPMGQKPAGRSPESRGRR